MRAPDFWTSGGAASLLLSPLGWLWAAGSAGRGMFTTPYRAPIPVVCVGNLVVGGAGKTPVAQSIGQRLLGAHFLSRGYGGWEKGPLQVNPKRHGHQRVGDEPLLLAEIGPAWVAANRAAGAQAAVSHGAPCLILDDGFQDPSLVKDVSLLVVDGAVGFGCGRCLPAGPLREPVGRGLRRASALVIVGEDRFGLAGKVGGVPVLRARMEPEAESAALAGQPVVAFAGIGRPAKFFESLASLGAEVVEAYAFPDHHPYHPKEIGELAAAAERRGATLVTTAKDIVRVPSHRREAVAVLRASLTWEDEALLSRVLAPAMNAMVAA
jgi:tetraacyldisaccharide 4'-kinase